VRTEETHGVPGTDGGTFVTTHWSVVLEARTHQLPEAAEALENLCRFYWYPLYAYVRRRGYRAEDAQDLTQAFFAHLLSKDFLRGVGPEKGRFRSFLLACLKHFLADEWEKAHTAKRGGASPAPPMDWEEAENRYVLEGAAEASPEGLYERRWAISLLDHTLDRLRTEAVAGGKQVVFEALQGCLLGDRQSETYAQLGARLGLSETSVKVVVHRLRQRYRELLRDQIAHTVARPEEIEEEMRYLFEVVSR
jgi:RNA polymerase sigma factor (sigma-70 family)